MPEIAIRAGMPAPSWEKEGSDPRGTSRGTSLALDFRHPSGNLAQPGHEHNQNVTRMPPGQQSDCGRLAMMISLVRVCGVAAFMLSGFGPVRAEAPLPELMTDTQEYCTQLRDRLAVLLTGSVAPPPLEVADLLTRGQMLCAHGHVRGGVQRLRRALVIMQQHGEAP